MKKLTLFISIFSIGFFSCKKEQTELYQIKAEQIIVDSTTIDKKAINNFIKPFKNHLNNELDAILSTTPSDLTKKDGVFSSIKGLKDI